MAGTIPLVVSHIPNEFNWTDRYTQFIIECEIPATAESNSGPYDVNKYSDKAMKIFQKMIEKDGIKYPILVASTKLYYKTKRKFVYKIGTYITEGWWRSDYWALLERSKDGDQGVSEHIQQEINRGTEHSKFKMG